ncbi:MAG: hypothetical protein ACOYXT_07175 [Bacteroidota bacterium]
MEAGAPSYFVPLTPYFESRHSFLQLGGADVGAVSYLKQHLEERGTRNKVEAVLRSSDSVLREAGNQLETAFGRTRNEEQGGSRSSFVLRSSDSVLRITP